MIWNLFADNDTVKERRAICYSCEKITDKWLFIFDEKSCSLCKCSITKKTKLKSSKCPMKKW